MLICSLWVFFSFLLCFVFFFFLKGSLKQHMEPITVLTDFFTFASALEGDGFMIYSSSECSSWFTAPILLWLTLILDTREILIVNFIVD